MAGSVVGQIALELNVNTKEFKQQLQNLSKTTKESTGNISGMLGKFGKIAAVVTAAKAIVSFSKQCLQLGSDLAEVQNVVDVTFGNMSNDVNSWAKNAMTSFGLSEKVAKEYVGQLGAMSKAFGNSTQEAYTQATELAGLVGDVASFYNLSTDEAFTKLKAVYTGETESLKSLGVVMTQTALDEYAMAKGFGKTTKEMSEQEKVALRLSFVQDRLSGASGDFARTSDGWANQTRVLALRFDALKASIGQGLINVLLPVVRLLNTILERLQVVADAFADFMSGMFGDAGSKSSGIGAAALAAGDIASGLDEAESSAKAIKKSLAGFDQINILSNKSDESSDVGTSAGGSTVGSIETVEPEISAGASAAGKLKGILEEVKTKLIEIANVAGFKGLWDDILISADNFKSAAVSLFDSVTGAVKNSKPQLESFKQSFIDAFMIPTQTANQVVGDALKSISEGIKEFCQENESEIQKSFENIITIATNQYKIIFDMTSGTFASLQEWWNSSGKRVFDEVVQVISDLGAFIMKIWNEWISPIILNIQNAVTTLWNQHLRPFIDELLALATAVWDFFKALWEHVKPIVNWLIEFLGPILVPIINRIVNTITNVVGTIISAVRSIMTVLRGLLEFVTGVLKGDWEKAWSGILTSFSGVANGIKTALDSIANYFKGKFETIKNLAKGAWSGVKSAFSTMGSWFGQRTKEVKNFFTGAWSSMKDGGKGAWNSIKKTFSPVTDWFRDKFTSAWNGIKKVFSGVKSFFSGIWNTIKNMFTNIGTTIGNAIGGAFKKVVNAIIGFAENTINGFIRAINGAISLINKIPGVNISTISTLNIPKLATGGYVAANTPQLAIIGDNKREGEIVAPESKITEAVVAAFRQFLPLFNNGGNNKPIYLTLKLGDGTFWEGFVDYHNDIVKRTGDTPLLI